MTIQQITRTNIRRHRKALSYNQTQLAEVLGVSRAAVGAYEEGRAMPPVPVLVRMSRLFSISLDALVTEKPTRAQVKAADDVCRPHLA
jgi:DNA-binding XRE family transcriptional regulator